jgi:hypothetical protein
MQKKKRKQRKVEKGWGKRGGEMKKCKGKKRGMHCGLML